MNECQNAAEKYAKYAFPQWGFAEDIPTKGEDIPTKGEDVPTKGYLKISEAAVRTCSIK